MSDAQYRLLFKLVAKVVENNDMAFHEKVAELRAKAYKHLADVDLEAFASYIDEIRETESVHGG